VAAATGVVVDVAANADIVRAFARAPFECGRAAAALDRESAAARKLRWFTTLFAVVLYTGLILFQFAFVAYAVHLAVLGRLGVGEVVMAFSLGAILGANVWALCARMLDLFEHLGVLDGALDIVRVPHGIADLPGAPALMVHQGEVRFEAVGFAHRDGTQVFRDFSLTIRPGEKVGIVGPSGAGKSTLIRLLRRQFEPQSGRILIDGQDIAGVSLASLNEAVAEVPQDPGLLHRSIADNIRYARLDAGDDEIIDAARHAHCHDFILRRPGGYDAVVGERGIRLSGGERQRIAIARAFLKPSRLLVLDEATSALDSETEHAIREALWAVLDRRTVIAIAHRLSTVSRMDRILYLEDGVVAEEGSHAELLARGGRYARLWGRQVDGFMQVTPPPDLWQGEPATQGGITR
jgi:ATP-binding cassette subfamily B protein